jgi:hypothetical protein
MFVTDMKKGIFTAILAFSAIYVHAQWKPTNGPYGGLVSDMVTKDN